MMDGWMALCNDKSERSVVAAVVAEQRPAASSGSRDEC